MMDFRIKIHLHILYSKLLANYSVFPTHTLLPTQYCYSAQAYTENILVNFQNNHLKFLIIAEMVSLILNSPHAGKRKRSAHGHVLITAVLSLEWRSAAEEKASSNDAIVQVVLLSFQ